MRATDDSFARARRALHQVDAEVDLARLRAVTAERDRSGTDLLPPDESDVFAVEILRTGQRPAHPRRRATVWTLAATVALLCSAGVGIATLWAEPGGTPPGSQVPSAPAPQPSREPEPDNSTTTDPRECTVPAPIPSPGSGRTADVPASEACSPTPAPSTSTDRAKP